MSQILVIEDNADIRASLEDLLELEGHASTLTGDVAEAKEQLGIKKFDLIISDVEMPGQTGVQFAAWVKAHEDYRYIPLVLLTARHELKDIIAGLEAGADDYITKPFKPEELKARIRAALRTKDIYQALFVAREINKKLTSRSESLNDMLGNSEQLAAVQTIIQRVAKADVPVLVTGETGTGKELAAHAVHAASNRAGKAFIAVNCSGFREELLASELFGHVKGSFTGAIKDKPGVFELADGGTLFLDELGEMPLSVQAVLLRVLQDGTFTPVGGIEDKKVSVRVIAATNRNLPQLVGEGKFREDLLFRINVVQIALPALRERVADIPLLAKYFAKVAGKNFGVGEPTIVAEAIQKLCAYRWPGNIRQLKNEIERASLLSKEPGTISGQDILQGLTQAVGSDVTETQIVATDDFLLETHIKDIERKLIPTVLSKTKQNRSEAAKLLGISRSNLIAKIKEYGLAKE